MTYATVTEVINTLPQIGQVSTLTSAAILTAIIRAESIIDASISRRYVVPVTPTPPLLTTLSCDLTIYRLMTRRLFSGEQMNKSDWPEKYKEAMEMLQAIADGSLQLVNSAGAVIVPTVGADIAWTNTQGYTPTFNEDGDLNSVIDPDKLVDIDASRT